MEATEIKANLGKRVRYRNAKLGIDSTYTLTGAIFRRGKQGFYYQAELQDRNENSVLICSLDSIEPIE